MDPRTGNQGTNPPNNPFGGQQLIQQARQQGQSFPDVNGDGIDDRLQDPNFLAQKTTQVHQQQPGLLGQLLGGASGGTQPVEERPRAAVARVVAWTVC